MTRIAGTPVQQLRGVGPKLAEKLADYGVHRVEDLLFHLPLRYQDRTRLTPIGAAQDGTDCVIEGEVRAADVVFGRRRSLVARLQDGSGTITCWGNSTLSPPTSAGFVSLSVGGEHACAQ